MKSQIYHYDRLVKSEDLNHHGTLFAGRSAEWFVEAGFIAAGALYALDHNRARLADDHANARLFAEGICDLPGIDLDPTTVQTNIVKFRVSSGSPFELVEKLKEAGVLMSATDVDTIRAVTHLDVTSEEVERAVEILRSIMEKKEL